MNARPAELLEIAIRNLKAGAKILVSTKDEEEEPYSGTDLPNLSREMLYVNEWDVFIYFYIFF